MPGFGQFMTQREQLEPEEVISDRALKLLNGRAMENGSMFLRELGLNIMKAGDQVPESGGVPRIFLLQGGKITSLEEENIPVGSREFWQKAMLGQVFAYPAGEKHPVQVQAWKVGTSSMINHGLSKPLDPEKLPAPDVPPAPTAPKKPRFYHRWFKFFGNNRKICSDWKDYQTKKLRWDGQKSICQESMNSCSRLIQEKFGHMRTPEALEAEKEESRKAQADRAEGLAVKQAQGVLDSLNNSRGRTENAVQAIHSMYQPKPEIHPSWIAYDPENPDPAHKGETYTAKQFAELKPLELNGVRVGGQAVTDREFATLAMCAALDPKIGLEAHRNVGSPEALLKVYQADGFSREEAAEIITGSCMDFYTSTMISDPPRAASGTYFKSAVQPGRESAQQALQQYAAGDNEALADILARTVGVMGRETIKNSAFDSRYFARNRMVMDMVKLMERDPALMEKARMKYEAHEKEFQQRHPEYHKPISFEEHLKSFRQAEKLEQMQEKSLEAKRKLVAARVEGRELSDQEKTACAKDILRANLLTGQIVSNVRRTLMSFSENEYNKERYALEQHALTLTNEDSVGVSSSGGSSAPADPSSVMISGLESRCVGKPDTFSKLDNPKAMEDLDRGLDKLMQAEGLDKAGTRELAEKLAINDDAFSKDKLIDKMLKANTQPARQEGEKEPDPQRKQQNQEIQKPGPVVG